MMDLENFDVVREKLKCVEAYIKNAKKKKFFNKSKGLRKRLNEIEVKIDALHQERNKIKSDPIYIEFRDFKTDMSIINQSISMHKILMNPVAFNLKHLEKLKNKQDKELENE